MRRARDASVVAVLLAGLLAGCGVATEDHPQPIDPSMMPPAPTPTVAVLPDTPRPPTGSPTPPTGSATSPSPTSAPSARPRP